MSGEDDEWAFGGWGGGDSATFDDFMVEEERPVAEVAGDSSRVEKDPAAVDGVAIRGFEAEDALGELENAARGGARSPGRTGGAAQARRLQKVQEDSDEEDSDEVCACICCPCTVSPHCICHDNTEHICWVLLSTFLLHRM